MATTIVVVSPMVSISVAEGSIAVTLVVVTLEIFQEIMKINNLITMLNVTFSLQPSLVRNFLDSILCAFLRDRAKEDWHRTAGCDAVVAYTTEFRVHSNSASVPTIYHTLL